MSLPLRERGLKLSVPEGLLETIEVAPPAGAWIETGSDPKRRPKAFGRSPCGSVD